MLHIELQGHAIKNHDLLIASGAISSRGSDGMSAVDDDMQAAVRENNNNPKVFMLTHRTGTQAKFTSAACGFNAGDTRTR